MSSNYIYEPVTHIQTTPVSTLEIEHNFGRRVNPCVYDSNGVKMFPYIEEIAVSGVFNKVKISFYEGGVLSPVANWKAVMS